MVAKEYGQDPRAVAGWEPDWIAAALVVMQATAAATEEMRLRDERRARQRGGRSR